MVSLKGRDYDRYHLSPGTSEYTRVKVCDLWLRDERHPWVPAWCERHVFSRVADCMWSMNMGPGYPLKMENRATAIHWWRMARLNARWRRRKVQDEPKPEGAA